MPKNKKPNKPYNPNKQAQKREQNNLPDHYGYTYKMPAFAQGCGWVLIGFLCVIIILSGYSTIVS